MIFEAPEKRCPTCGLVLPSNGYELDEWGNNVLNEDGQPVWRDAPMLICESCVLDAAPPMPKRPRKPRGYRDEDQMRIEAPTIEIR